MPLESLHDKREGENAFIPAPKIIFRAERRMGVGWKNGDNDDSGEDDDNAR